MSQPERDHFSENPAPWLAGTSDIGLRHRRNEDALALAAGIGFGDYGVLVVCDGVSTAPNSDIASLAAARAARASLADHLSARLDSGDRSEDEVDAVADAIAAANAAVVAAAEGQADGHKAASCTLVLAAIQTGLISWGSVGDSRAYWIPDGGEAQLLSTDDSVAQVRIAAGVDRAAAEQGPGAHAITRWLGPDAPEFDPETGQLQPTGAGWLVLCTDGLWNYASAPEALGHVLMSCLAAEPLAERNPQRLAQLLIGWANQQGGRDNITVALARLELPA